MTEYGEKVSLCKIVLHSLVLTLNFANIEMKAFCQTYELSILQLKFPGQFKLSVFLKKMLIRNRHAYKE